MSNESCSVCGDDMLRCRDCAQAEIDEARDWAIRLKRVVKRISANDWDDADWLELIIEWATQPDWLKEQP